MTAPTPYLFLPGTAREALAFYAGVFGSTARWHTLEEFGRTDGPPDAIAHGYLSDGPVTLFIADATGGQTPFRCEGMMLSLLGTAARRHGHSRRTTMRSTSIFSCALPRSCTSSA